MSHENYENRETQQAKEESKMKEKKSGGFKGKAIAFAAGAIACGVGSLIYKYQKRKEAAETWDDEDDFDEGDYFEDEEIGQELDEEESSEESEEN